MRSGHFRRLQQTSGQQLEVQKQREIKTQQAAQRHFLKKTVSRQDKEIYEEFHENKKVIIVGGGFAGLSCAYELLSRGFNVTILERRNRVGGRVYSSNDWISGKNLEHGGELVGSKSCHVNCHYYMNKFGLELIPLVVPEVSGNEEQEVDPMFHLTNAVHFLFAKLSECCNLEEPWRGKEGQEKKTLKFDRMSLSDWFNSEKTLFALGKAYEAAQNFPPIPKNVSPNELLNIANKRLVTIRNVVRTNYANHKESDFLSKTTLEFVQDFIVVTENLFEHNNGIPTDEQSLLFTLLTVESSKAAFKKNVPHDGSEVYEALADTHFLTDNEQGRVGGGNMSLASNFYNAILEMEGVVKKGCFVQKIKFKKEGGVDVVYEGIQDNTKFAYQSTESGDYVVLACPSRKWMDIEFEGARDKISHLPMQPQMGKLLKVLLKVNERFWEKSDGNPSGAYDMFLTWETTESQGQDNEGPFCFVCFAGGRAVSRIKDEYREGYNPTNFINWIASRTREQIDGSVGLIPDDMIKAIESVNLMDWSDIGYSCSGLGEITTIGAKIHDCWDDRMWIVGEHACLYSNPGFMEGALASGRRVAKEVVNKDNNDIYQRIKLNRDYVAVGKIIYDGVVNGHPRIQVPVRTSETNPNGSYGKGKITNKQTQKSCRITGVNHWNWDGSHFYFWPVYSADEYTDNLLEEFKSIIFPGAEFTVSLQVETVK